MYHPKNSPMPFQYSRRAKLIVYSVLWIAAVVISCLMSLAVALASGIEWLRLGFYPAFALSGFLGVLSGTLCLPSEHRRFGSFILVFAGLSFYLWLIERPTREAPEGFPHLLPLAAGGMLAALAIQFRRRQENTTR